MMTRTREPLTGTASRAAWANGFDADPIDSRRSSSRPEARVLRCSAVASEWLDAAPADMAVAATIPPAIKTANLAAWTVLLVLTRIINSSSSGGGEGNLLGDVESMGRSAHGSRNVRADARALL
jgi:hypothetical protein